jgi:hypothetical protein
MSKFVVIVKGGLGNQLFQMAFALNLIDDGNEIVLNKSLYNKNNYHDGFQLDRLFDLTMIGLSVENIQVIEYFLAYRHNSEINQFLRRLLFFIYNFLLVLRFITRKGIEGFRISDNAHRILKILKYDIKNCNLDLNAPVIFDGYWQSIDFAKTAISKMNRSLKLTSKIKNYDVYKQILSSNSVAIHFRGGDFKSIKEYNILTENYYRKSIDYLLLNITEEAEYYLFYDDYDFMKSVLPKGLNKINYVSSITSDPLDDFLLMKSCSYIITSNSTFSWWAAMMSSAVIIVSPNKLGYEIPYYNLINNDWKLIDLDS